MKKIYYTLLALAFYAFSADAQNVTTIAGTGGSSASGDGGPATAADIGTPTGITADASGNIYIADYSNDVIRKISTSGTISLIGGTGSTIGDGGAATAASVYTPFGIAVDASGNVYVAVYGQSRIRKINTSGIISTIAGTGVSGWVGDGGPATAAQINGPSSIVLDASNNIYFTDRNNNRIRRIDAISGTITTVAGTGFAGFTGDGGAAIAAKLDNPIGLAIDASDNLFVADYGNLRIRKISSAGIISTFAGDGTTGTFATGVPATTTSVNGGIGVAVDASGNVYIAEDATGNKVRVVNSSGIISDFAGTGIAGFSGDGGAALSAKFYNTKGLAFDASGNAYIIDAGNYRIRKVEAPNHEPAFTEGNVQSLSVCQNSGLTSINALLTVNDVDPGQTKSWSTAVTPANGTLVASYSTTSAGGVLTPSGLTYVPGAGYSGADMFKVRITDGISSDTTTINVTVNPVPAPTIAATGSNLSTGSYVTYQWSTSAGTIVGATNSVYTAITTGIYYVTVTDVNGCVGQSEGQAVTGLGIDDSQFSTNAHISNPVTDGFLQISIPSTTQQMVKVNVNDATGRAVLQKSLTTNTIQSINLDVPSGIYYVTIISDRGCQVTKLVVQ